MQRSLRAFLTVTAIAVALFAGCGAAAGSTYHVIYRFVGGSDGASPTARLVADGQGNLYGTTFYGGSAACSGYGCGTIFELRRPTLPGAAWTETVLYRFTGGSDDMSPVSALARGFDGDLYGTTSGPFISCEDKIQCGTVYELAPPGSGRHGWTLKTLHAFTGHTDGGCPLGDLFRNSAGDLFGTACYGGPYGFGTVYELSPPLRRGDPWTETVLFGFPIDGQGQEPHGGIAFDAAGNAYGTTYAGGVQEQGVAFELSPAGAGQPWSEKVLAFFDGNNGRWPLSQPFLDSSGNVYATTLAGGCTGGTVFQLTPPTLQLSLDYVFCGANDGWAPTGQLTMDAAGNIYGTTTNGGARQHGTAFALTPPAKRGGAWTEVLLHSFYGGHDGSEPMAGVIMSRGDLFGTTIAGGTGGCLLHGVRAECGIVYEIEP
jgi:uncharacterized repeat protein (TIGR03803 family)